MHYATTMLVPPPGLEIAQVKDFETFIFTPSCVLWVSVVCISKRMFGFRAFGEDELLDLAGTQNEIVAGMAPGQ